MPPLFLGGGFKSAQDLHTVIIPQFCLVQIPLFDSSSSRGPWVGESATRFCGLGISANFSGAVGADALSCHFRLAGSHFPSPATKLLGAPLLTNPTPTPVLSETAILRRPRASSGLCTHLCHLLHGTIPCSSSKRTYSSWVGNGHFQSRCINKIFSDEIVSTFLETLKRSYNFSNPPEAEVEWVCLRLPGPSHKSEDSCGERVLRATPGSCPSDCLASVFS